MQFAVPLHSNSHILLLRKQPANNRPNRRLHIKYCPLHPELAFSLVSASRKLYGKAGFAFTTAVFVHERGLGIGKQVR